MSRPDPTGRLLTEIRDDAAVVSLGATVVAGEPTAGLALGPGHYRRFVVLVRLATTRLRRAPVQEVRYVARCYGTTYQDAAVVAAAVSDAVHARGHRITPTGVAIFGSFDDGGGGAAADPDTGQPYETVFITAGLLSETLPIG